MLDPPAVRTDLDGAIRRAVDAKTKPPGSLGAVEALATRIARVQGTLHPESSPLPPHPLRRRPRHRERRGIGLPAGGHAADGR